MNTVHQRNEILAAFAQVVGVGESWDVNSSNSKINDWKGIRLNNNNNDSSVVEISLRVSELFGIVALDKLPSSLMELHLGSNKLSGNCLETIQQLPPTLTKLFLDHNRFSGCVNWSALPSTLRLLYLHNNQFSGEVEWDNLPESLCELGLNKNLFSGPLFEDWNSLPPSLTTIHVAYNDFHSDELEGGFVVNLNTIPERIQYVCFDNNPRLRFEFDTAGHSNMLPYNVFSADRRGLLETIRKMQVRRAVNSSNSAVAADSNSSQTESRQDQDAGDPASEIRLLRQQLLEKDKLIAAQQAEITRLKEQLTASTL